MWFFPELRIMHFSCITALHQWGGHSHNAYITACVHMARVMPEWCIFRTSALSHHLEQHRQNTYIYVCLRIVRVSLE